MTSTPDNSTNLPELIDVSNSGDEPMGIIAEGHVDIDAFRARCIERQSVDHGLDESEVDPCVDVQHLYYVAVPSSAHEGDASFVEVPADWWGAKPVTVATFEHTGNHWTVEKLIAREAREHQELMALRADLGHQRGFVQRAIRLLVAARPHIPKDAPWQFMVDALEKEAPNAR